MAGQWRNKTVVVTGGSSGLGLAIAQAFAARQARLILIAHDQARLQRAGEQVGASGGAVEVLPADLTRSDDVREVFARIERIHPTLDVLVNAVGRSDRASILDTTEERFQELWELNFLSAVRCTRAAIERLLVSGGHLVNIGSLASKTGGRYLGAYPAGKFALAAYSQQLRLELGPRGLHVLLVCPGPIRRPDAGQRYDQLAAGLPESARRPGGGARLSAVDPAWLANRIVRACETRQPELVVPAKARWLFALAQLWPTLGDRILSRQT